MLAEAPDPTDREAALAAALERAEARIAELEAERGRGFLPPLEWGLTGAQARLFGCMMSREVMTRDAAMVAMYRDRCGADDEPEIKIVDVQVCKMRKALKPFGIEIRTRWGVGYFLTEEAKAHVRAMLAEATA